MAAFETMIEKVAADYARASVIATTLPGVRSATVNDWTAIAWSRDEGLMTSRSYDPLEVLDSFGGEDTSAPTFGESRVVR